MESKNKAQLLKGRKGARSEGHAGEGKDLKAIPTYLVIWCKPRLWEPVPCNRRLLDPPRRDDVLNYGYLPRGTAGLIVACSKLLVHRRPVTHARRGWYSKRHRPQAYPLQKLDRPATSVRHLGTAQDLERWEI